MSNFIKNLEIEDFKSIKYLQLDCKRVNILIGKPNVGKSNILEAIGLHSVNFNFQKSNNKFLSDIVRYQNIENWFYDNDSNTTITIRLDSFTLNIGYNITDDNFSFYIGNVDLERKDLERNLLFSMKFDKTGVCNNEQNNNNLNSSYHSNIKRYEFNGSVNFSNNNYVRELKAPFGENLFQVLLTHKSLLDEISKMLKPYGQDFLYDVQNQTFETQKKVSYLSYKYPYLSVADTFRRLIFHLAAIESNKDAVLLFEEPESHSYPPYIWQLANRIAQDVDNQYFITTHSPYMLETLMQELGDDDLNIWVTYFENYETKVHPLSKNELQEMYDLGGDIFFNMDKFEKSKAV
jgi:AAA15 family ATPase/GTPase